MVKGLKCKKFSFREVYQLDNLPNNIRYYFSTGNEESNLYEIQYKNQLIGYIVESFGRKGRELISFPKSGFESKVNFIKGELDGNRLFNVF